MSEYSCTAMPDDFPKRIHRALKAWYARGTKYILDELLLFHEIKRRRETATQRFINNQILMDGFDRLKLVDAEAFDLLQRRFLNKEQAQEIAYRLNVTSDIVYQRQRLAIAYLAQLIWELEMELRKQQARRVELRLAPQGYTHLFSIQAMIEDTQAKLETLTSPWIIAIEGMGGVGKTSFADALVRVLAHGVHFQEIAWLSARQQNFRLTGVVETCSNSQDFTLLACLDQLIEQFELKYLQKKPNKERFNEIKRYLKSVPALIIIDNLETVCDYPLFITQLQELTNPSKFLITTRYSLRGMSGVYIQPLQGLSYKATLALIRHEAEIQGLDELASASDEELTPIYNISKGNPLATKLIIGKVHTFSLPTILSHFKNVKSKPVTKLLEFMYEDAWDSLSPKCRQVMQAVSTIANGEGQLEQITTISGLSVGDTASCLRILATHSLLETHGDLHQRRFILHPLTRTFVNRQFSEDTL